MKLKQVKCQLIKRQLRWL